MMRQTRAKTFLLPLFLLTAMVAMGQEYRHAAKLDSIPATGFYHINLTPEILSYLKLDQTDLRIEDKNKKLVPYLIQSSPLQSDIPVFIEFPILSNRIIDSGKTELIFRNDSVKHLLRIRLFLKNAAVSRRGSLSGSDDGKSWFIINDQVAIERSHESVNDEYLQEIVFPGIKYRYYKIVIDNQKNDPMNIVRVGIYNERYLPQVSTYEKNPHPVFSQRDSGKLTLVNIKFDRPYHISRFSMWSSSIKFFNREFALYKIDSTSSTRIFIGNFVLNSAMGNFYDISAIKSNSLLIIIDNKDNPPLKIDQITTEHTSVAAIAYLESNNSYRLLLDNPEAPKPDYDLVHFKDSIPESIGSLNPQSIVPNELIADDSKDRKWWIWPVLIAVIAIMGLLTYKLSGDVKFNVN